MQRRQVGVKLHTLLHPVNQYGRSLANSRSGVRPKKKKKFLLWAAASSKQAILAASAPNDFPDLMASAHSSLADFSACERAASIVPSSEPSGSWINSAPSLMW